MSLFKWLVGLAMGLALAGCQEGARKRDESEDRYCAMVARWKADAAAGVAPKNRTGWPPFNGECK